MPRPAPLSRDAILDAAIALVETEGSAVLSMRTLARSLGVEAMSLYNHVANKQDVLDGMCSRLITQMQPWEFDPAQPWQDVLRGVCLSYHRVLREHSAVFLAGGLPLRSGDDADAFARIVTTLVGAGFTDDEALDVFLCGSSYTRAMALMAPDEATPRTVGHGWDADRAFVRGLDALVRGFETQLDTKLDTKEA